MDERPILFSAPMVRAILDGRKSQTRRIVKPQPCRSLPHTETWPGDLEVVHPLGWRWRNAFWADSVGGPAENLPFHCPHGRPGDRLWVRENFAPVSASGHKCAPRDANFVVLTDGAQKYRDGYYSAPLPEYQQGVFDGIKWRPSIFMPRWASRITLEVTGVRVERLQEISEDDARAEGVEPLGPGLAPDQHIVGGDPRTHGTHPYTLAFACLWDEINGDRAPWSSNPWVFVIEFRRLAP